MVPPIEVRRIHGILVSTTAPEQWQWQIASGCTWTFELWGHRLYCAKELVCQGLASLPRCIDYSRGYEAALADMIRKANQEAKDEEREKKRKKGILEFPTLGERLEQ
jgi:hypothetical protein